MGDICRCTARWAAIGALWLLAGCAPLSATVDGLTREGRSNELKAIAKYRQKRVRVSGTIESVGVRKVEEVVASRTVSGATGSTRRVPYPYVNLVGRHSKHGDHAVCYFTPYQADTVGGLKPGSAVTLECEFQEYDEKSDHLEVILNRCVVHHRW
jgi:hypothetical protein